MRCLIVLAAMWFAAVACSAEPKESCVQVVRMYFQDAPDGACMRGHWGSGTVIKADEKGSTILTCRHAAPTGKGCYYFARIDGKDYPCEWVKADDKTDLAMLHATHKLPAVTIADATPTAANVYQWGYSNAGPRTAKQGRVSTLEVTTEDGYTTPILRTTVRMDNGDSGVGVLTHDGKLIGVGVGSGSGLQRAVALPDVRRFVYGD